MKYKLCDFDDQGMHNVSVLPRKVVFNYSDGEQVEKRIYDILVNAVDRTCFSKELISQITDWPTEYHFSPLRHNLLRQFNFGSSDRILELGCGCGAITRQLGETGASVTAIEGNYNRAKCAAVRCDDLDNVKVYCANFQDIEFSKEFDYVVMIGVLEYSPVYFKGSNPVAQCLGIVKSALKGSGRYLLAIENRLGLKYFSGLEEDHVGIPYFGIQNLYKQNTVVTYGRLELYNLLQNNGFNYISYYYPFPDYKIPKVVFSEEAFSNPIFKPAEIISQLNSRAYSNKTSSTFDEKLVWPILEANKLIPDLSNSFLVISCFEKKHKLARTSNLASYYTVDRLPEYNVRTDFLEGENSNIIVRKNTLRESQKSNDIMIHQLEDDCYYSGTNLDMVIRKAMRENDFEEYLSCLRQWIDFVLANGIESQNDKDIYRSLLKPDFIDCIPINLLLNFDGIAYIDREWKFNDKFTLLTLLLRYLDNKIHSAFINKSIEGSNHAWVKLLNYLGITITEADYKEFRRIHDLIDNLVYSEGSYNLRRPKTDIKHNNFKYILCRIMHKLKTLILSHL